MDDLSRKDIRRILKTFGIKADEMVVTHLAKNPGIKELRIRLSLEDLSENGDLEKIGSLNFSLEDIVRR